MAGCASPLGHASRDLHNSYRVRRALHHLMGLVCFCNRLFLTLPALAYNLLIKYTILYSLYTLFTRAPFRLSYSTFDFLAQVHKEAHQAVQNLE